MKKLEAAVTAYVHAGTLAAMAINAKGMGVQLNSDYDWLFFHLGQDALITQADREFVAERLFDYALKYQYKPEILYRQHAYWYDMAPQKWEDVDATLRLRFAVFQASAFALAPFVETPAPAEPEARPETRTHGFERGFGDEDGGGRALKIGEERLPMSSPVADRLALAGMVVDDTAKLDAAIKADIEAQATMPRENVYTCPKCCQSFTTVDVDHGVTPFLTSCKTEGCDGLAESAFYPRGPRPDHVPAPAYEWYRPQIPELADLAPHTIDHLKKGGLLLRARTDREPIITGDRSKPNDWDEVAMGVDALFGEGTTKAMRDEIAGGLVKMAAMVANVSEADAVDMVERQAEQFIAAVSPPATASASETDPAAIDEAPVPAEGTQVMDPPAAEVVNPPAPAAEVDEPRSFVTGKGKPRRK